MDSQLAVTALALPGEDQLVRRSVLDPHSRRRPTPWWQEALLVVMLAAAFALFLVVAGTVGGWLS